MTDYLASQLPAPMAADPNIVKFVRILEEIAGPIYRRAGQHHLLISPATAPPRVVEWVSAIMGLEDEDGLPVDQRRRIAAASTASFAHRGSAASIAALLEAYTGQPVRVIEAGSTGPEIDELHRIGDGRPAVHRPDIDTGVRPKPQFRTAPPGVVRIELETLGRLTPERLLHLVRQRLPAHLVPEIVVAGKPLAAAADEMIQPEAKRAS